MDGRFALVETGGGSCRDFLENLWEAKENGP